MTIDNAVDIDMCIFALSLKFWFVTPKEAPLPISTLLRLTEGLRPLCCHKLDSVMLYRKTRLDECAQLTVKDQLGGGWARK